MIGIDTNVIVRYIMQDDARQSVLATRFMESLTQAAPGFLSHVALVEMVWVLSSAYGLSRAEVTQAFEGIVTPFEVARDVTVPVGGYRFNQARVSYQMGLQRRVSGGML